MICPVCRKAMKELRRTYHKKRKWVCPACGRVRMQNVKEREKRCRQRAQSLRGQFASRGSAGGERKGVR